MLILILIDVPFSQKAVFSFEKGSNHQNHSSLGSQHLVKKSPTPVKSPIPPSPPPHHLPLFGKPGVEMSFSGILDRTNSQIFL